MNAPINDDLRSKGGRMRDQDRPAWQAQFMGAVAGSRGLLKKDHSAASDAKEAVGILKQEAAKFPNWIFLTIVGRDGRTVRSTLSESHAPLA